MPNLQKSKNLIEEIEPKNAEGAWANSWRPIMAIIYSAICVFDFIIGPIFWTSFQIIGQGSVALQWVPLTLIGGGIFHVAMGAILGVSAFTRGQEKIQRLKTLEEIVSTDQYSEHENG